MNQGTTLAPALPTAHGLCSWAPSLAWAKAIRSPQAAPVSPAHRPASHRGHRLCHRPGHATRSHFSGITRRTTAARQSAGKRATPLSPTTYASASATVLRRRYRTCGRPRRPHLGRSHRRFRVGDGSKSARGLGPAFTAHRSTRRTTHSTATHQRVNIGAFPLGKAAADFFRAAVKQVRGV